MWAALILLLELAIAVTLITAVRVGHGLTIAIFLNVNFVLIGSPNPSIFYLVLQLGLALWMLEASQAAARSVRVLRSITIGGLVMTGVLVPSVATVDPAHIVDDPAATLAAWTFCGAIAASVASRRLRRRLLQVPLVDLRSQPKASQHT